MYVIKWCLDAVRQCHLVNSKGNYIRLWREGNEHQTIIYIQDCVSNGFKMASRSFKDVANSDFGMAVTNLNLIHEEIKNRLNSGNTCYHSVQNVFSSHLLSKT
jgi:hypothetical protein